MPVVSLMPSSNFAPLKKYCVVGPDLMLTDGIDFSQKVEFGIKLSPMKNFEI